MLDVPGVKFREGSLDQDVDTLAALISQYDIVIDLFWPAKITQSDADDEKHLKLVEACKQAGTVQQFFAPDFGGDHSEQGQHAHLYTPLMRRTFSIKERVTDKLKEYRIPYTKVINYLFFNYILPRMGSLGPAHSLPETAEVYGDGTKRGGGTAEEDIGKVVARAVGDQRTINKKLIIKGAAPTQAEIIAAYERVSGKQIQRVYVSAAELSRKIADEAVSPFERWRADLNNSIWVHGLCSLPPEELSQQPAVYATDLYPDIQYCTMDHFFQAWIADSLRTSA